MKPTKTTALIVTFAAFAAAAFAEPAGPRPARGEKPGKPDPAALVTRLTEDYAKIAPYDLNVNGQLEESEQEQLADAITAGTATFTLPPGRIPPEGVIPPAEHLVRRLAGLYAAVAPYDANVDASLSADEQAALKTAIESGKLPGLGGHRAPKGAGFRGRKGDSASSAAN